MEDFKIPMNLKSTKEHERTIVHIDIDCFYAQVEMIRNPELRDKPLGIQQKNIVVTCNYIAREYGVRKLMFISDAYKCCPELVLVSGEDLTYYRTFSNKVTELLQARYSRLVERLGFDENFVDITDVIATYKATDELIEGHVYGDQTKSVTHCSCGCYNRLVIGSKIATQMRKNIYDEFGLTTCAGISYNKLLSKLVGSTHKPNQQTTLLPEQAMSLINKLPSIRAIPGIGKQTAECLKAKLSIITVESLQSCSIDQLAQALASRELATNILMLSFGMDDSEVKESVKAQSIGVEDAFKEIKTMEQVDEKLRALLTHLLQLLFKEEPPRMPGTLRITVRKYMKNVSESTRESRQCPIPTLNLNDINKCTEKLIPLVLDLFKKIINVTMPFHLTLLGISFTNLSEIKKGKASILTFMGPASKKPKIENSEQAQASSSFINLPPNVDPEVFSQLPSDMQEEILCEWKRTESQKQVTKGKASKNTIERYLKK